MAYFYESRFVDKPFKEVVDGRMSIFDDIEYIQGVKEEAIRKGYDLKKV